MKIYQNVCDIPKAMMKKKSIQSTACIRKGERSQASTSGI